MSCIDCVKRRSRRSTARIREAVAQSSSPQRPSRSANHHHHGRNYLYDIEIIEEERDRVKIHYVGYGSSSDEWIRKTDIRYKPVANPRPEPPDAVALALSTLASSIKQKLVPSRNVDPAVRIQLPMNEEAIQLLHQRGRSLGNHRGHAVYGISEYSDLDELLGKQWHMRIDNTFGDFAYAIKETIRYHVIQPKSLLDFEVTRDSSGELKFSPFFIEQPTTLIFRYVRKDDNKAKLGDFV